MELPHPQPVLTTDRLVLRPLVPDDASVVQQLAGDHRVADTTLNIPHPYPPAMADAWIARRDREYAAGDMATWAVTDRATGALLGAVGLHFNSRFERAELGYWIGAPYWHHGYATEAARAVLRFAFEILDLHRVNAGHFARNPASGRVMEKIGMKREGMWRQHVRREGRPFEDVVVYGLLRSEWRP